MGKLPFLWVGHHHEDVWIILTTPSELSLLSEAEAGAWEIVNT
jgi:hypothetical protein